MFSCFFILFWHGMCKSASIRMNNFQTMRSCISYIFYANHLFNIFYTTTRNNGYMNIWNVGQPLKHSFSFNWQKS
uniref:Putative secreted protein n=1 Tax=Panstrongylus lignarius TaxID=156445 RepID=A0A224Y0G1_9HEMI